MKDKGPHLFVRQIVKYNDEELWIGTESGIYVYNLKNSNVLHLTSSRFDKYSLSDNSIHSMFVDDEGGMWIGSFFGGVNYLSRSVCKKHKKLKAKSRKLSLVAK